MKECSLCSRTPRELKDEDAIRRVPLAPPLPPAPGPGDRLDFRTQCPECSAVYVYSHSGEWDDTQYFETIQLTRLSFAASKVTSPPPDFQAALQSPSEWVRRNAAWNLSEMGEAIPLLASQDAVVREEALQSAQARNTTVPEELLRTLMRDESARTRKLATSLLVPRRIARGEVRALFAELQEDPDPVRVDATLWGFLWAKDPAVGAESAAALPLLSRADDEVRRDAAFLLHHAFRDGRLGEDARTRVLGLVQGDDERAAAGALGALSGLRTPSPDAVQGAVRWLPVRSTRFEALRLLQEQATLGADLSPALQGLSDLLSAGQDPADPCKVLLAHLAHARDKVPVVRAMIPALRGHWGTSIVMAIDQVASKGADLTSLLPLLRSAVTEVNAGWMRQLFRTMNVE